MQEFLLISTILSWFIITLNLIISLMLIRHVRESTKSSTPNILEIGTQAPDFSLETLGGSIINLTDYKDRERLIFFVSPTCQHCHKHMPHLKELSPRMERDGTHLLLVSLGEKDATQAFMEQYEMQQPVLISNYNSDFTNSYKVAGTPSYYLINSKQVIEAGGYLDASWEKIIERWEKVPM